MINQFIDCVDKCHICNNKLTLVLQFVDSVAFKFGDSSFKKFETKTKTIDMEPVDCELFDISYKNNKFSSNNKKEFDKFLVKKRQAYFYAICNTDSVSQTYSNNYEIDMHDACYYKSSHLFQIAPATYMLEANENDNFINNEVMCVKNHNGVDKTNVYTLAINNIKKTSTLWKYSFSEEEKSNNDFVPEVFEKIINAVTERPSFKKEDFENTISKFESWILLS